MKLMAVERFLQDRGAREEVRAFVKGGGPVIYPTDTLYGLGVDPAQSFAMENLFRLKGRERDKAVPLLLDRADRAREVFGTCPESGKMLAQRFWPGKLTIVSSAGPLERLAGFKWAETVGVRHPDSKIAVEVAAACGGLITGTSANRSGGEPPVKIKSVMELFSNEEIILIDGGDLPPSRGSTVVRLDGDRVEILREGDIGRDEILEVVEELHNG